MDGTAYGLDGKPIEYRLRVQNTGNGTAGDCEVTDDSGIVTPIPLALGPGEVQTFETSGLVCGDSHSSPRCH